MRFSNIFRPTFPSMMAVMIIPETETESTEDNASSAGSVPRNTRNMTPVPVIKVKMKNDIMGYRCAKLTIFIYTLLFSLE
jgi:hypothetical protein